MLVTIIENFMAGKIKINTERCKGCGLCVAVCPENNIVIAKKSNESGYFPAESKNAGCTACCMCAIVCPEAVIEVYKDENNRDSKMSTSENPDLIRGRT